MNYEGAPVAGCRLKVAGCGDFRSEISDFKTVQESGAWRVLLIRGVFVGAKNRK
jgi:hypothetical protein